MNKKTLLLVLATMSLYTGYAQINGVVRGTEGEKLAGATVRWLGTNQGTNTDVEGTFSLAPATGQRHIVVSSVGYRSDTVQVSSMVAPLDITLESLSLAAAEVVGQRATTTRMGGLLNGVTITKHELTRAACCNLGESFTTNPSVDVSYSDPATGARQIKLLGLAGTYVQMLTDNVPNFRGAASPYALSYVPGTWISGIQVSKGSASVKQGYESMTGQINVAFKDAKDAEQINLNAYANSKSRIEVNADVNRHLTPRLGTNLLTHYSESFGNHDSNGDGFLDEAKGKQINLRNGWAFQSDRYVLHAALSGLKEERESGQTAHAAATSGQPRYGIGVEADRYEAYLKNAFILNPARQQSIALITSGTYHRQQSHFGHKIYNVNQRNAYAALLFDTDLAPQHSMSVGASLTHDHLSQRYRLDQDATVGLTAATEQETVAGAYAQYTFNHADKIMLSAGLRLDHSSRYGTFATPRAHIKYSPVKSLSLRASAGKGYRTVYALAENSNLLASGRRLLIEPLRQEAAWNFGASLLYQPAVWGKTLTLSAEYYYTTFDAQALVDYDTRTDAILIVNGEGDSYSHTLQLEASYPLLTGLTFTAAYRLTDVKATYGGRLLERPLTSRYKGLTTLSYKTPLGLWQIDATLQLNGGGRMPTPYTLTDGSASWDARFPAYEQLSAQITRWFRGWSVYVGGENLTAFSQKQPIIAAHDAWSSAFEPTMIWAPTHGALFYAGIRVQLD